VSVGHVLDSCKSGGTNRDAVLGADSGGPKESCIRWGLRSPREGAILKFCPAQWKALGVSAAALYAAKNQNGVSGTAAADCSDPDWLVSFVRSFVRLFVLCGQGSSLLWTPALRPYSGPVLLPRERKRIGRCVRCVLATCVEGRSSTSEQLVGYFYRAPFLDVAVWLSPDWRCILRQPAASQIYLLWLTQARQADLTHFPLWKIRRLRCGLSSTLFWPLVIIVICCNTNKLSK